MITKLLGFKLYDIEASNLCNLNCKFCPRHLIPKTGFMSKETFNQFIEKVPLNRRTQLTFVGIGEPLLNPNLHEFIRLAKEKSPTVRTWVTTNGTLLSKKKCVSYWMLV